MPTVENVTELAKADDFFAAISVVDGSGRVHTSVVKAGMMEDPRSGLPSVAMVVMGGARKLALVRRSRRATVVFTKGGRWVSIEGPARVESRPESGTEADREFAQLLRTIFSAAGGTHDNWGEFDRVMREDGRCAVFVEARTMVGSG